jgi:hypothetical protein
MRHMFAKLLSATIVTTSAMSANAVVATCTYKFDNVTADPAGNVNASLVSAAGNASWFQVCNVDTPYSGVPVAACKAILSNLLVAKVSQRDTLWWFDSPTAYTCSAPAAWGSLKTLGWYWGPALM